MFSGGSMEPRALHPVVRATAWGTGGNALLPGALSALLALSAPFGCSRDEAPWLTALTPASHAPFPIERGAHGGLDCNECHGPFDTFAAFTCIDCHAHGKAETDGNHANVEGYAYDSAACYDCHADGGLVAGPEHELKFPVADGTAHGEVACASCHVTPGDRKRVECLEGCHGAAETTAGHGPVGGYVHATAGCLLCHADSQVDRVSDHRPFRIAAGSSHYRKACADCHPSTRPEKPFPALDFARFDCLDCHERGRMEDKHDDVGGFRYESRTCVNAGCHADGEEPDD
jgi:hypothetical protein